MRDKDPDIVLLWVDASSEAGFELAYRKTAATLQIPGYDDPKADIFTVVFTWLEHSRNGRWLIVLDDADGAKIISEQPPARAKDNGTPKRKRLLTDFVPQVTHGMVLVTTKDQSAPQTSWSKVLLSLSTLMPRTLIRP